MPKRRFAIGNEPDRTLPPCCEQTQWPCDAWASDSRVASEERADQKRVEHPPNTCLSFRRPESAWTRIRG